MCASRLCLVLLSCFFFNDTATTEIYTLSLHDALPISMAHFPKTAAFTDFNTPSRIEADIVDLAHEGAIPRELNGAFFRSEEHTSELQSLRHLVCRLLLEKKKTTRNAESHTHKQLLDSR